MTNFEFHKNETSQLEAKVDNENFKVAQRLQKLEGYEKDIATLFEKDNILEKHVLQALDQLKREQEHFKSQIREMTDKNDQRIQKFTQEQWVLQDRIEKVEEVQQSQSKYKAQIDAQLIELKAEIHPLSVKKLDSIKFEDFVEEIQGRHKQLCEAVEKMTDDVETSSNYVQKYIPMQI